MSEQFNQLLQYYVNQDYNTLLSVAKNAINELYPVFKKYSPDGAVSLMAGLISTCVAVDGQFTELEYEFLGEVMGIYNYEELKGYIQHFYNDKAIETTKHLVDTLEGKDKTNMLTICLCVCAADESIKREETALLHKLFSQN